MKTLAIVSLLLIACAAPVAAPPPEAQESSVSEPDIRGEVTNIDGARLRIEELPKEERGAKAVVKIADETIIRDSAGRPASSSAIRTGHIVRVWYTGPVMKSYPLQATAARIEIE